MGPRNALFWSPSHEKLLLDMWEERYPVYRINKTNTDFYKQAAIQLVQAGFDVDYKAVRTKIDNLTGKYRREKRAMEKSDGVPSQWRLFERVHRILGQSKPTCFPQVLVDTKDAFFESETEELDFTQTPTSASSPACSAATDKEDENFVEHTPKKIIIENSNDTEMTPYELAMIEIARNRSKHLNRIAMARLEIMDRIAKDNSSFHAKMLDFMIKKSKT